MSPSAPRPRSERLAVLYLQLADAATRRGPASTRDRLLLLAGRHATRAGWEPEADTCRELVLASNPHHVIGRHSCFTDALQSEDYLALDRQLERQCPQEKAEHLAMRQDVDIDLPLREPPRLVAHNILARLADNDAAGPDDATPRGSITGLDG